MILGNSVRGGAGRENPNLTIGSQSSMRDIKVQDYDVSKPLDHARAIASMKDNIELYYSILNRFRSTNILPALKQIKNMIE